jgi:hypothetical protein
LVWDMGVDWAFEALVRLPSGIDAPDSPSVRHDSNIKGGGAQDQRRRPVLRNPARPARG